MNEFEPNKVITIKDIVYGLNNGAKLTRVDTKEVTVCNSYGTGGQNVKAVQTSTNLVIEYITGYELDVDLIGFVMLEANLLTDKVFTSVAALMEVIEQGKFSFDPYGACLGVNIDEAVLISKKVNSNDTAAYDTIREDFCIDSMEFKQSVHNELVDMLNSKALPTLTDVAEKAKLDAIEFLKQHSEKA